MTVEISVNQTDACMLCRVGYMKVADWRRRGFGMPGTFNAWNLMYLRLVSAMVSSGFKPRAAFDHMSSKPLNDVVTLAAALLHNAMDKPDLDFDNEWLEIVFSGGGIQSAEIVKGTGMNALFQSSELEKGEYRRIEHYRIGRWINEMSDGLRMLPSHRLG